MAIKLDATNHEHMDSFQVGDTVRVLYRIREGEKVREQPFEGIVIGIKGSDVSKTFTVRRIGDHEIGIERIFPVNSPNISKLSVLKKGKVRRAKLYYLREKVGKAAERIKAR
jgi:large subunit ribosomal protein L19